MADAINQRIKKFRRGLHYTQEQIALKMGMKPSTYSQMERCGKISSARITQLAEILETDAITLLYGETEKTITLVQPPIDPKPVISEEKPLVIPNLSSSDLTAREAALVKMFKNISEPNKTLVYEFVCKFFQMKDFKEVIKTMNLEV